MFPGSCQPTVRSSEALWKGTPSLKLSRISNHLGRSGRWQHVAVGQMVLINQVNFKSEVKWIPSKISNIKGLAAWLLHGGFNYFECWITTSSVTVCLMVMLVRAIGLRLPDAPYYQSLQRVQLVHPPLVQNWFRSVIMGKHCGQHEIPFWNPKHRCLDWDHYAYCVLCIW